jgi:signal transduction histidine kinase
VETQTLRHHFRLLTALLILGPSLLIMTIYTVGAIHIAREENLEALSQRLVIQKRLVDYWLAERASDVREISMVDNIRSLDKQRMTQALQQRQKLNRNFDSLSFIGKDGQFVMTTLSTGIRFPSAVGKPYYETAMAGKEYISDVVVGRNSGQQIINVSAPVYDNNGNIRGLILGSIRTSTLEALLKENWLGKTGEVFLVNRDGVMLSEPRFLDYLKARGLVRESAKMKFRITESAADNIRLGGSGTATWRDYRDKEVLGAYLAVPERDWTIIGKIDEREVLAPIYGQLKMMGAGALVLVLLIMPLAAYVTGRIKRPIEWLIAQSNLVSAEQYGTVGQDKLADTPPRELAVLCETFVTMSRKIDDTVGKLRENELALAAKVRELEASNKELESFSYAVSHDLRAPLRSIDGFSQILVEEYADKVGAEGVDYLKRVRQSTQRMTALIDDLLKLSRAGRADMTLESLDISVMVQAIAADYSEASPDRKVEWSIQPGLTVHADRALLQIMLVNLIDNAWKYTGKNAAARIEFGLTSADGGEAFYIRDNGVGFDMAYAGKLFIPFQRLHPIQDFPGTGIGLATVMRIMRRHGGDIWAEASPGQGAAFYFRFNTQGRS